MLRNTLFILLILFVGKCYSQEDYFVLIQADNNQPFYARLEDKTLNSTSKGRLTLSQLKEGGQRITIGWPKQMFPEQQYSFNINGKDLELQLKDHGDNGWGLFNPQTQEWLPADKKEPAASAHIDGIKKDDAFSRLMAGVVSDTAVMYNTYAMEAALKDSPAVKPAAVAKVDTISEVLKDTAVVSIRVDSPAAVSAVVTPAPHDSAVAVEHAPAPVTLRHTAGTVVKLSERKTSRGLRLAFADRAKGRKADTVIVIIPMDSSLATAKTAGASDSAKSEVLNANTSPIGGRPAGTSPAGAQGSGTTPTGAPPTATETVSEYKSDTLHLYLGPKKGAHAAPASGGSVGGGELYRKPDTSQRKVESKPVLVNSDCRNFATDYDVDKLRVKMLEISKDDDKTAAAKKIFKTRCFTTKQIKALSEVFTTDAAKYRFFEAAYPFVSDDRFRDLTDLLADPVYNSKFRAMTGQR
ncbi:MAG TPA: DUF4476 domain-containing protein [Puia sp.]|nr:DUF4476 domain-containing protein [Puia sp.]